MPSKDPLPPKESALFRKILVNWCIALLFYYFFGFDECFCPRRNMCSPLCIDWYCTQVQRHLMLFKWYRAGRLYDSSSGEKSVAIFCCLKMRFNECELVIPTNLTPHEINVRMKKIVSATLTGVFCQCIVAPIASKRDCNYDTSIRPGLSKVINSNTNANCIRRFPIKFELSCLGCVHFKHNLKFAIIFSFF